MFPNSQVNLKRHFPLWIYSVSAGLLFLARKTCWSLTRFLCYMHLTTPVWRLALSRTSLLRRPTPRMRIGPDFLHLTTFARRLAPSAGSLLCKPTPRMKIGPDSLQTKIPVSVLALSVDRLVSSPPLPPPPDENKFWVSTIKDPCESSCSAC